MKKFIPMLICLSILVFIGTGHAAVIWQENFDSYAKDYSCSLSDCSLNPGLPPGYSAFGSNALCKNYGRPNAQIVTGAERTSPGSTNKRGFRINLEEDCLPPGENILRKNLGADYGLLYIRWYQRDSVNAFSNFQKLFRLKKADGNQILIPEFQVNSGKVQMNLWDSQSTSNHFFTGYDLKTNYTPGTWVSYEIKIDLINKQAEFWVNGVSKGSFSASWWPSTWRIRYIEIGGNQYGHSWAYPTEQTRDYDDIVISTSYVGPSGSGTSPTTVPAPKNLRITGQ